jgi:hypothetical protein
MELALLTAQRRGDVATSKRAVSVDDHLQVDRDKARVRTRLGIPLTLRLEAVGWTLGEVIDAAWRDRSIWCTTEHPGGHYSAGAPVDTDTIGRRSLQRACGIEIEDAPPRRSTKSRRRSGSIRISTGRSSPSAGRTWARDDTYADPRDSQAQRMIQDPSAAAFLTNSERW